MLRFGTTWKIYVLVHKCAWPRMGQIWTNFAKTHTKCEDISFWLMVYITYGYIYIYFQGNSVTQDLPPTGSEANTPCPLYPLPTYLANRKSYLVSDCPIYIKFWSKVKLDQLKSVWTLLKITCTSFRIWSLPSISQDMAEILSPIGEMAEYKFVEHLHENTKLCKIILNNYGLQPI